MDGHHRWVKKLMTQEPIKCIRVDMNGRDGSRVLNKIQDIYEYEQSQNIEEVMLQDVINSNNEKDSGVSDNEFFAMIESDVPAPDGNKVTLEAYRKQPIKENSVVGNYFLLKPQEGYDKYEIEFDNLLDTEQMGIDCDNSQESPTDLLAKVWFPHINFTNLSETHGVAEDNLKNKAIAEKADKMGYDGIKYGNNILQGLK